MKAKAKFLSMYRRMPHKARKELVLTMLLKSNVEPYSLNVVAIEVKNNTRIGKRFLKLLGYEDDVQEEEK